MLSGVGEIQGTFDGAGFQFGSLQVPVQMRPVSVSDVADLNSRIHRAM